MTALETVSGLNVYSFPPLQVVPPFAFPAFPDQIIYDMTYGRGTDRFLLPVYVGTGAQGPEDVFADLAGWADGSAFKAVLEAITGFCVRVTTAEFTNIGIAGGDYPAVKFMLDIAA